MTRLLHVAIALGLGLVVAASCPACSSSCTGECDRDLDHCLRSAPPGAARSDCYAKHSQCVQSCESSR